LNFEVTEQSIADACGLPLDGEHWFKNQFIVGDCNQFLKDEYQNPPWSHGMPLCMLNPEWSNYLLLIQQHFTGDGRYSRFYLYHLRFLLHLIGKRMNVPYYFLRSLSKMERKIQTKSDKSNPLGDSLYHQGLIKLLILHELKKTDRTWEQFLFWGGFETTPSVKQQKKTRKRNRISKKVENFLAKTQMSQAEGSQAQTSYLNKSDNEQQDETHTPNASISKREFDNLKELPEPVTPSRSVCTRSNKQRKKKY
jgi:hypothetical protein